MSVRFGSFCILTLFELLMLREKKIKLINEDFINAERPLHVSTGKKNNTVYNVHVADHYFIRMFIYYTY